MADDNNSLKTPARADAETNSVAALVTWLTTNRAKIIRFAFIPQAVGGLIFLLVGYGIGKVPFHLLVLHKSSSSPGIIVGFKTHRSWTSSDNSATVTFNPVVQFRVAARVVEFENWLGSRSSGNMSGPVTVFYDPADPAVAMIDKQHWNWIWAPPFAIGLFLVLVAFKGLLVYKFQDG